MAGLSTRGIMMAVALALLPGTAVMIYFYGNGVIHNLLLAVPVGLAVEAVCLRLQRRPVRHALADGSTILTCVLIALALPPATPFGILGIAVVAAVALAKHLYGGLGNNLFNPALVGYAVVLVSFPVAMASWPVPVDGETGATALVSMKYREGLTVAEAWQSSRGFGAVGGYGWEWINLGFLLGGAMLVWRRLAAWRVPTTILATIGVLAAAFWDGGSSASRGSPLFHWFTGSTMLTVFFFATDPVTHPASPKGQIVFGVVVGAAIFVIRAFGNYPDGAAFAILFGNALAPYLDKRLHGAAARA
jgi:electron transport complex protein RnfD